MKIYHAYINEIKLVKADLIENSEDYKYSGLFYILRKIFDKVLSI